ncbi:unnamed protein product [Heterobilharzia americana]|nr:unnamed protein product [Heterobilharzia americana]
MFQYSTHDVRLPLHKKWKILVQVGLRIALILISLGDVKYLDPKVQQLNLTETGNPDNLRLLKVLQSTSVEIYEAAHGVLCSIENVLRHLPPNNPCMESEILFLKGHLEMRLYLENKVDWKIPSQTWTRSICISAYITGDNFFQHRTQMMLVYFWQLVLIQERYQYLSSLNGKQEGDTQKTKTGSVKKDSQIDLSNGIFKSKGLTNTSVKSIILSIWNSATMIDAFLSESRHLCSSSSDAKSTYLSRSSGQNNNKKSIGSKSSKTEPSKLLDSKANKAFVQNLPAIHQFDLVAQKCLDSRAILAQDEIDYEMMNIDLKSKPIKRPIDYVRDQNEVNAYWNSLFVFSLKDQENREVTPEEKDWKRTVDVKLDHINMDTIKLYQSILYENLLNIRQSSNENKEVFENLCKGNYDHKASKTQFENMELTSQFFKRDLLIPIIPLPYYSQHAEYWCQRFTSFQLYLHNMSRITESEGLTTVLNNTNTKFIWCHQTTNDADYENSILLNIAPYKLQFEPQTQVRMGNEKKQRTNKLAQRLLVQMIDSLEQENSINKNLWLLIYYCQNKTKSEAQQYQFRLVSFQDKAVFFKAIEQFNKIMIKYAAANVLSDTEKVDASSKSTSLKISSVKQTEKSPDADSSNRSNQGFQSEFGQWLNEFDAILQSGKILHTSDVFEKDSQKFIYVDPNPSVQRIKPSEEVFNGLKEIISWRYFGGLYQNQC